jgi:Flp pilus assembly protein TadD
MLKMEDRHFRSRMVSAQRKREAGNWIAAADIYLAIIRENPSYTEAHSELARLYLEHDRIEEARALVDDALEIKPNDNECRFLQGLLLYIRGDFEGALTSYKQVEKGTGLDPSLRINIALVYEALGKYEDAIRYLEPVMHEPTSNWKVFEVLSDLYLSTRNVGKAAQILEIGVKKFPNQENLHFLLGSAYFNLRNYSKAAAHLTSAEKNLPTNRTLRMQLGISLVRAGQIARGIEILKVLHAEEPWNLEVGMELANSYTQSDQPRNALKVLEKLSNHHSDNKNVQDELARVRFLLTHPEDYSR